MSKRSQIKQTYANDREQYGYTLGEWDELSDDDKPCDYKKCATCHRFKDKQLFMSQYSKKEIKICNFCQCRGYHKYRIDGGVSCEKENGICDTNFIINTCNHINFNFREIDLSDLVNTDKIAVQKRKEKKEYYNELARTKITCKCGAVVCRGGRSSHMRTKKCQDIIEAMKNKQCNNNNDNDTESTATGGSND